MTKERTEARMARLSHVLRHRQPSLTLVLANIHDRHNVSAIYRSCDAFGVEAVNLLYTDTAFPVLGEKSSASARKWVQTHRHKTQEELISKLKAEGKRIYATNCSDRAKPLQSFDFTKPSAIILGNEHSGVSEELMAAADEELYIPMYGMIQSFNVSVAAALILYEASRQREAAGMYASPSYTPEKLNELLEDWAKK